MLIIEIALGIVLGFILIKTLPHTFIFIRDIFVNVIVPFSIVWIVIQLCIGLDNYTAHLGINLFYLFTLVLCYLAYKEKYDTFISKLWKKIRNIF